MRVVVVKLSGDVAIYRLAALRETLEPLETLDRAIIDLTKVTFSDLTLINALVHLRNQMSANGARPIVTLVGAYSARRRALGMGAPSIARWPLRL